MGKKLKLKLTTLPRLFIILKKIRVTLGIQNGDLYKSLYFVTRLFWRCRRGGGFLVELTGQNHETFWAA